MGLIQSATCDARSTPKKQSHNITKKVELPNMPHRLKSAAANDCHFKINESTVRTIVKRKENS